MDIGTWNSGFKREGRLSLTFYEYQINFYNEEKMYILQN